MPTVLILSFLSLLMNLACPLITNSKDKIIPVWARKGWRIRHIALLNLNLSTKWRLVDPRADWTNWTRKISCPWWVANSKWDQINQHRINSKQIDNNYTLLQVSPKDINTEQEKKERHIAVPRLSHADHPVQLQLPIHYLQHCELISIAQLNPSNVTNRQTNPQHCNLA